MQQHSAIHNTFVIERTYNAAPGRVFAAFADRAKKRRWFAEGEHHEVEEFTMDFRAGGHERAVYRFKEGTPFAGVLLAAEGIYLDIAPNQRIVSGSTMAFDGKRISASLLTVELLPADMGTNLICTHQGVFFEGSDGPTIREAGWRKLLEQLSSEFQA